MVSFYVNDETEETTLALYQALAEIDFPEGLTITLNNLEEAESGLLIKEGQVVDISLAHCYTLQDAIREMARLLQQPRLDHWEDQPTL